MSEPDDVIIGIDLGTTNSLVAWADAAGPRIIPGDDAQDRDMLPSVVGFDLETGTVTVGTEARPRRRTTAHYDPLGQTPDGQGLRGRDPRGEGTALSCGAAPGSRRGA